ncbi:MAG TPA: HAD-IIIA family hydrolase [Acidimicrobiia bacterium]|jgi:D-glycero-D-manno-heptose 1,7-bisphosphate phosphatase
MSGNRAVFLDRDGVLARSHVHDGVPTPPASVTELEILPGVVDACAQLHRAGFLLVCVTNQPDIARGRARAEDVAAINASISGALGLDDVLTCPHDDADDCACRKPRAGMLREAAARWEIDLRASVMVGDRWRDIEAGREAGCATVFVDHGYAERQPEDPDLVVEGLPAAVTWIRNWGILPPARGTSWGARWNLRSSS